MTNKQTEEKTQSKGSGGEGERRKPGTSTLEWFVSGVSGLTLVGLIFYLVVIAFTGGDGPAQIAVRAVGTASDGERFVVEFLAVNSSGTSVAGVEIRGEMRNGGEVIEEASVTLDYLPQHSEGRGAMIFRNDPTGFDLVLSATGYVSP